MVDASEESSSGTPLNPSQRIARLATAQQGTPTGPKMRLHSRVKENIEKETANAAAKTLDVEAEEEVRNPLTAIDANATVNI